MSVFPAEIARTFQAQKQGEAVQTDSGYSYEWSEVASVIGVIYGATYRDLMLSAQTDFTITHTIVHEGRPVIDINDRFRRAPEGAVGERFFYVNSVEDPGEMGLFSIYAVEERRPG